MLPLSLLGTGTEMHQNFRPRFARHRLSPLPSRFLVRRFFGRASRGTVSLLGTELFRFSRARVRTRTVTSKSIADALRAEIHLCWILLRHCRVLHGREIRKLFAKTKRSRAGDDPGYQQLCSTPKTKKVVIVSVCQPKKVFFLLYMQNPRPQVGGSFVQ